MMFWKMIDDWKLHFLFNMAIFGTLPETNMAPKNVGWEDDPFLLGLGLFSVAMLVVGRVSGQSTTHTINVW